MDQFSPRNPLILCFWSLWSHNAVACVPQSQNISIFISQLNFSPVSHEFSIGCAIQPLMYHHLNSTPFLTIAVIFPAVRIQINLTNCCLIKLQGEGRPQTLRARVGQDIVVELSLLALTYSFYSFYIVQKESIKLYGK